MVHNKGKKLISETEQADWDALIEAQERNEDANSRCIGLVIETRPDWINENEIVKFRKLGATKIQIGIQSLNDKVMELNKRGHGKAETEEAIRLLRMGGFKIHAHWMPNLYGSTPELDIRDFKRLWGKSIRPDELKIYPTSIIENTGLLDLYKEGKYKPYTYEELLHVMVSILPLTPRYCRLTRIIRDIPSTDIIAGNKLSNFREIAEKELQKLEKRCQCIRCREIQTGKFSEQDLEIEQIKYRSTIGEEIFISVKTRETDKIVAFLRLTLPTKSISERHFIDELSNSAIIREVHVYGQAVDVGKKSEKKAQHMGLGTILVEKAQEISRDKGFKKIAVISAIGTRNYYRKLGFYLESLYMTKYLAP